MAEPYQRDRVFISYVRKDKEYLDRLLEMLAPMIRRQPETIWWDGRIKSGQKWREEIEEALARAKVAMLLVSPGFLASEFIYNVELRKIHDFVKSEEVKLLWSLVRDCLYDKDWFSAYQAVPSYPLTPWNTLREAELDSYLKRVSIEIEKAFESTPYQAPVVSEPEVSEPLALPSPVSSQQATEAAQTVSSTNVRQTGSDSDRKAKIILTGVEDLELIDDIGHLFVLQAHRGLPDWANAAYTFDRMVELATPHRPSWMAYGYENLGLIYQRENRQRALECWKISWNLYRRIGNQDKAAELANRLRELRQSMGL
jgi:TIR domain